MIILPLAKGPDDNPTFGETHDDGLVLGVNRNPAVLMIEFIRTVGLTDTLPNDRLLIRAFVYAVISGQYPWHDANVHMLLLAY